MPNESDIINAQEVLEEEKVKAVPVVKERTPEDVINQSLEKITYHDKNEEYTVHTYHPHHFTKDYLEGLLEISKKMKKEIYVIDWANKNSPKFCKEEKEKNPNAYFLLIPNQELIEFYDKGVVATIYFSTVARKLPYLNNLFKLFDDQDEVFEDLSTGSENRLSCGAGNLIALVTHSFAKFKIDWTLKNATDEQSLADRKSIFTYLAKQLAYITYNCLTVYSAPDPAKEAENYNYYYVNSLGKVKRNLEIKLRDTVSQLLEQQKALFRYEKQIMEINDNIVGADARINDKEKIAKSKEQLAKVFTSIFKDKFRSIRYGSDYIVARTKCIYIDFIKPARDGGDDKTCHRYKLGEYDILIHLNGSVKLTNLTAPMGNYDHPHVSSQTPCLGNLSQSIPKMIAEGDYLEVLLVMYDFLKTVNRAGWYGSGNIYNWPTVKSRLQTELPKPVNPKPICEYCDLEEDECDCSFCEHCDEHMDNCRCEFCEHCDRLVEECDSEPCEAVRRQRNNSEE